MPPATRSKAPSSLKRSANAKPTAMATRITTAPLPRLPTPVTSYAFRCAFASVGSRQRKRASRETGPLYPKKLYPIANQLPATICPLVASNVQEVVPPVGVEVSVYVVSFGEPTLSLTVVLWRNP